MSRLEELFLKIDRQFEATVGIHPGQLDWSNMKTDEERATELLQGKIQAAIDEAVRLRREGESC